MSGKPEKYALLFGFERGNDFNTGFLKIGKNDPLYSVTKDESEASRFGVEEAGKVLRFVSGEEELSGWKFHVVKRLQVNSMPS